MEQTESGLFVDEGVIEKERKVIPRDEAKIIQRAVKVFEQNGLLMLIACKTCAEKKHPQTQVQINFVQESGQILMECGCSVRLLEKTYVK